MPLTFDMPRERLRTYIGTNPRPKDFDEFWDNSIAEIAGHSTEPVMEDADFQSGFAKCRHLYFHTPDGAKICAQYLTPRNIPGLFPLILMFHGYTGNAGDWFDKLPYVGEGFAVAAMDCRGQGGRSTDPGGITGSTCFGHVVRGLSDDPENLLFRRIYMDTAQLAQLLMAQDEIDETCVHAYGRSQGGGLALACAALEPRIKRVATVYPFLCDYKRVWELDLMEKPYQELCEFFRWHDPCHETEDEIFTKLGYIDVQFLCPRIQGEVFMGVGLMDRVCPPSTQFAAYNKISSPKSLAVYPDFNHEDLPGHSDKVFRFLTA